MNFALEADKEHDNLKEYSKTRFSELAEIFSEENKAVVNYEELLCRATLILGHLKPKDTADQSIRDLLEEVRKFLGSNRMGLTASEDAYKKAYEDYSGGSHPNRKYVPYRYLGEPNEFVLGSILKPELLIVGDYFSKLIGLWSWLTAMISVHYFKFFEIADPKYGCDYMKVAEFAQKIANEVLKNKCVNWSEQYNARHQNDVNAMVNS